MYALQFLLIHFPQSLLTLKMSLSIISIFLKFDNHKNFVYQHAFYLHLFSKFINASLHLMHVAIHFL